MPSSQLSKRAATDWVKPDIVGTAIARVLTGFTHITAIAAVAIATIAD
jgi:hypothetical protein